MHTPAMRIGRMIRWGWTTFSAFHERAGPAMDIELEIEGVADRAITEMIRKTVRRLGRQVDRPGEWRVSVAAAETRGRWDVGIRTPTGWHLTSFSESLDALPAVVERTLREQLIAVP